MPALDSLTLADFLKAVSAKSPTPGGGAVASSVGAIAASLARMVVSYSLGKKNLAQHQPTLEQAAAMLDRAGPIFIELAEEDAAAYALLNDLMKLPDTDPRRAKEMPVAVGAALAPPCAALAAGADLLRLIETLVPITNRHLRSDLAIAAVLAESAAVSAWWNIAANLSLIPTPEERTRVRDESLALLADARTRRDAVERACTFDAPATP